MSDLKPIQGVCQCGVELLAEFDQLKCELALLKYGPRALNHALADVNDTGLTEVCKCPGCFIAKRFSPVEPEELSVRFPSSEEADQHQCIILKCLTHHCETFGLTCKKFSLLEYEEGNDDNNNREPEDLDCHLVIVDKGLLWEVEYGRQLASVKLHTNKSLPALIKLFTLLEDDEDFFKVDGENYYANAEDAV